MKHLRFVILVLLLGFLPALLYVGGTNLYLQFLEEDRISSARSEMTLQLKELRDEQVQKLDRLRISYEILMSLYNLKTLNSASITPIIETVNKRFPDLLNVMVYSVKEIPSEEGIAPKAKFESIYGKPQKYSFIYKKLINYLQGSFTTPPRFLENRTRQDATLRKTVKLITDKLLGKKVSLSTVRDQRREIAEVENEGKQKYLFWDLLEKQEDTSEISTHVGILLIFIDQEKFMEYFSTDKLLARKNEKVNDPNVSFSSATLSSTKEIEFWHTKSPMFSELSMNTRMLRHFIVEGDMYSFMPTNDNDSLFFIAKKSIKSCFPEKQKWQKINFALALVWFLLFASIASLIHFGQIQLFISVRYQLATLFLLAALLPLSAIFYLGFQYLKAYDTILEKEAYGKIRNRILDMDEGIHNYRKGLATRGMKLLKRPEISNKADTSELELEKFESVVDKLKQQNLVDGYYVIDNSGNYILMHQKDRLYWHPLETMVVTKLAQAILNFYNKGYYNLGSDGATTDDSLGSIFKMLSSEHIGITDKIIKNRGKIHEMNLLSWRYNVIFEPIVTKNNIAIAIMGLSFNINRSVGRFLHNYVDEKNEKKIDQEKKDEEEITLIFSDAQKSWDRFPRRFTFHEEISRLFEQVRLSGIPMEDSITFDGEEYLILGMWFKEVEGFMAAGLFPKKILKDQFNKLVVIFIIVFLLSIVIAVIIGISISRKFITPVRDLQVGVRAIADGDLDYRMHIESNDELGALAKTFNSMVGGLQEKERMSRYVSEFVISEVKQGGSDHKRIGEKRKGTILFADIRDFTTHSETYPPEEIVQMLNDYLDAMTQIIMTSGGVIDKFIGDAIMAVFYPDYPPGSRSDESRAVLAALEMRDELFRFNERRREEGLFEIDNGIGINTGEMIQGSIGAKNHRVDLTVVGDGVNVAARLESLSKNGKYTKIIISGETLSVVKDMIHAESSGEQLVKGKSKSVEVFEVVGLRTMKEYLPLLSSENTEERLEGIRLLGVIRDSDSVDVLLRHLVDENDRIRTAAGIALRHFKQDHTRIVENLFVALKQEKEERIKATLIMDIGELATPEQCIHLQPWLSDESPRVRANAIEIMSRSGNRERLKTVLLTFMRDENNRVRANTCVTLFGLGELESVNSLIEMTQSTNHLPRASGAWGLSEIASRGIENSQTNQLLVTEETVLQLDRALEVLHQLLADQHPMVLSNVVKGLGRIGNHQSVVKLINAFHNMEDDEIRMLILGALDQIGSYRVVRQLKNQV